MLQVYKIFINYDYYFSFTFSLIIYVYFLNYLEFVFHLKKSSWDYPIDLLFTSSTLLNARILMSNLTMIFNFWGIWISSWDSWGVKCFVEYPTKLTDLTNLSFPPNLMFILKEEIELHIFSSPSLNQIMVGQNDDISLDEILFNLSRIEVTIKASILFLCHFLLLPKQN